MTTMKINESNFDLEVTRANQPVLVAFYASWCKSRRLSNLIDHVSAEMNGAAKVVKVDVDESPNLASRFNVSTLPSFVVLDHGQVKTTRELQLSA
jgi:thioredoxin 1